MAAASRPGSAASGSGSCGGGQEVYETPAAAVLTAALPADAFRLFGATDDPAADLPRQHAQLDRGGLADPRAGAWRPALRQFAARHGRRRRGERRVSGRWAGVASLPEPLLAGDITATQRAANTLGKAGIAGLYAGARCRGRDRADAGLHADRPGAPDRRGARQCRHGDRRPPGAAGVLRGYRPGTGEGPAPSRRGDLRRPAGCRLRHRRLSRAQPDGDRPAARLDRARRRGRAGRPDPVLPARPRQRARRSRTHAAPAEGAPARGRPRPESTSAASRAAPRCSASRASRRR